MQILLTSVEFWFFTGYSVCWFAIAYRFAPFENESKIDQLVQAQKTDEWQAILDGLTLILVLVLRLSMNVISTILVFLIASDMLLSVRRYHQQAKEITELEVNINESRD